MRNALIAIALLASCVDVEPETSVKTQDYCAILDQAYGNCPGQEGCVPIDSCVDSNIEDGSCCIRYGHPKSATSYSVTCTNEPGQIPTCVRTNVYDFVLVVVTCTTTTQWLIGPDGNVYQDVTTVCTTD